MQMQQTTTTIVTKRREKWQFQLSDLPELSGYQEPIAGVDEVGRGALFGPVVAASVILPLSALEELARSGVRDSKKLTRSRREKLAEQIRTVAHDCQIGFASPEEIDKINIFHASLLAMKRAVTKLQLEPALCLVDGKQALPDLAVPQLNLVKGDEKSLIIAAASIVGKVWRDRLLVELATQYPDYDLLNNKGYGTARHLQALQKHGPTSLHRMSFSPCRILA